MTTCCRCAHELPAKRHAPGPKFRWCRRCQPFRNADACSRWYYAHRPARLASLRRYRERVRARRAPHRRRR